MSEFISDKESNKVSQERPKQASELQAKIKVNDALDANGTYLPDFMAKRTKLDITWGILMVVTLLNALVAETAEPHVLITLIICCSIAYKGRLVIDNFMELYNANKTIRSLMRSYFYVFPVLIFLADVFSEQLANITRVS